MKQSKLNVRDKESFMCVYDNGTKVFIRKVRYGKWRVRLKVAFQSVLRADFTRFGVTEVEINPAASNILRSTFDYSHTHLSIDSRPQRLLNNLSTPTRLINEPHAIDKNRWHLRLSLVTSVWVKIWSAHIFTLHWCIEWRVKLWRS